jgi:hypothetical protein
VHFFVKTVEYKMPPKSDKSRTVVGYLLRTIDEDLDSKDLLYRQNMTLYPTFAEAIAQAEQDAKTILDEDSSGVLRVKHKADSESNCARDGNVNLFDIKYKYETKEIMAFAVYAP